MFKLAIVSIMLVCGARAVGAVDSTIEFHVECLDKTDDCANFEFAPTSLSRLEPDLSLQKQPALTVGPADMSEVQITKNEFGQNQVLMKLKPESAEKLSQLTRKVVGRRLPIVVDGKVLTAPNVNEPINGDSFALTLGRYGDDDRVLTTQLPWLRDLADRSHAEESRWNFISVGFFVLLGLLIVGLPVYYAFVRRRPEKSV